MISTVFRYVIITFALLVVVPTITKVAERNDRLTELQEDRARLLQKLRDIPAVMGNSGISQQFLDTKEDLDTIEIEIEAQEDVITGATTSETLENLSLIGSLVGSQSTTALITIAMIFSGILGVLLASVWKAPQRTEGGGETGSPLVNLRMVASSISRDVIVGASIGLLICMLLLGGVSVFIVETPGVAQNLNPYGYVFFAALAGLFSEQTYSSFLAWTKRQFDKVG